MHTKLIVGITGHRPDKLNCSYSPNYTNPIKCKIKEEIETQLLTLEPDEVITGMALGVDQWMAEICIKRKLPFVAAIPCLGQSKVWSVECKKHYEELLSYASKIITITEEPYQAKFMQIRNEWIVDHSDILLAVWDGTTGGTKNCIDYALRSGKLWDQDIIRINPKEL